MSQNGLPFWLKTSGICLREKQIPCFRYTSIVTIMAFSEASTDSFELLDATLMTEEAAAAREESERLRIQEARLAQQLPLGKEVQPSDLTAKMTELQDCIAKLSLLREAAPPSGAACPGVGGSFTRRSYICDGGEYPDAGWGIPERKGKPAAQELPAGPVRGHGEREGMDNTEIQENEGSGSKTRPMEWFCGESAAIRFSQDLGQVGRSKFVMFPDSFPSIPDPLAKQLASATESEMVDLPGHRQ